MKSFKIFYSESKNNFEAKNIDNIKKILEYIPKYKAELSSKLNNNIGEKESKIIHDQIEWYNLQEEYAKRHISIDPHIYNQGYIRPNLIYIPKEQRDKGVGSELMNRMIQLADKQKRRMCVSPDKNFGASSVNRLKSFYKRFGFVENSGRHKDFSISETMYRDPR
jgi:GNAT superfamily N-acetyltransferase